ncbi:MAG: hypothetical protein QOE03_4009, partial [Micromonosporaceae bacterium]|nr:hypothetical protein [Micromonosporaceae bacterium]
GFGAFATVGDVTDVDIDEVRETSSGRVLGTGVT